jgi:O-antigen/teichoic acid export membrane protein
MMATAKILYKSFYWKIFQFFISFAVNLVFVRTFQSAVSAQFYSLLYLLSLASSFFTLGLDIGLNYYLSKNLLSARKALGIIALLVVLALLISLPLIYLDYRPSAHPSSIMPHLILFSALGIAGNLLTTLSTSLYTVHGQNHLSTALAVVFNSALLVISILLILLLKGELLLESLFFLYFIFSFFQGLFIFIYSYWLYSGKPTPALGKNSSLMQVLRFSFAAFSCNFLFFAGMRMNVYLLPYWTRPEDLGNYIQAFKLVEYIALLVSFLYYPFMSVIAQDADEKKIKEMVLTLVRLSNSFVLVISLLLLLTGWFLFPFVFGHSFNRMYYLLPWFIPGLFAACSSTFFTAYFFGKGRIKYNFWSAIILLLSGFLFFFVFIHAGGPAGAALAFSLSGLLSFCFDSLIFKKDQPYRIVDLLFARKEDIQKIRLFIKDLFR